jgi:tRNA pseudouridine38-40 synthase
LQPNTVTVQKVLDEALSTIMRENISTTGAGRTDSGVHASFFCAHFDSVKNDLDKRENLIHRLNRYLPSDIAINNIRKVANSAHARYSAISRTYRYFISRHKDPFNEETSWLIAGRIIIDIDSMNRACNILMKHSDFTSFSRFHSNAKTNICKIYSAEWEESGNMLIFTIRADRFLRNMVRAVVGTMIDVGTGKIGLDDFEKIILSKDRCKAGKSAPAKGLFLTEIEYPGDIFL